MSVNPLAQMPRTRISDAMRQFGLTARALRFYEDRGLIEARRDRFNTRYYEAEARQRLVWIALLRRAGVSLGDIEEVLVVEDEDARRLRARAKVLSRRDNICQELALVDETLSSIAEPRELRPSPRRLNSNG